MAMLNNQRVDFIQRNTMDIYIYRYGYMMIYQRLTINIHTLNNSI